MINSKKALVVGGGVQHALAIRMLKEHGFVVILVDNTPNPPAKEVADKHIQENAFNSDILEAVARKEAVDIIFNICYDLATPAVGFVSKKLCLPSPYTYEQALQYTDKMQMKEMFVKYGIPTAKYCIVSSNEICNHNLTYPIVVKPVDSSGSRGIAKVFTSYDCVNAVESARNQSRIGNVLLEEFIEGDEYQVDCVVEGGRAHVVLAKQKLRFEPDKVVSPAGSLIVPDDENRLYEEETSLANKLAKIFGIKNGVFFYQCIEREGVLYMIELGVRLGGGLGYKMIKEIKGVDFVQVATDAYLKMPLKYEMRKNTKYYLTNAVFATRPCLVQSISGLSGLYSDGTLRSLDVYHADEFKVDGCITNKNRLALFMIEASNMNQLRQKYQKVIENISIKSDVEDNCFDSSLYYSLLNRVCK